MITIPDLRTALLDLLHEIEDTDIALIVGGGFGIYLKTEHVRESGARTLFNEWPEPRSTNDLDLFLRAELLVNSKKLKLLAEAIKNLGYQVIPTAKNFQFVKPGSGGDPASGIKIDLLTGTQDRFKSTTVKTDSRRARPRPSVGIHAHVVDEATTLEDGLLPILVSGKLSSGEPLEADIFLPHPYTFLMMKLFAFGDRSNDEEKELGRYHALDLYTVLATTMENEWEYALELRDKQKDEPYAKKARLLVSRYFSASDRLGIIRLKESPYYRPELQLDGFMSAIKELFPEKNE